MTEYSRRQFLHDSLLAAAAAATAGPIGNALAAEITATVPAKGPNEKLSFAIIGVNGQGNSHIGNLVKKQGEVDIAIICDVDETIGNKRCDEIAKQQDGRRPKYVRDLRKCSTTSRSIAFPPQSPITGTHSCRFGPCKPAKTCTLKNRPATT